MGRRLQVGVRTKPSACGMLATGQQQQTLTNTNWVNSIAFSPDGKTLANGTDYEETIHLWDVATGQRKDTLTGHTDWVITVAFSPDGKNAR